jgi:serine/threonine protein kinase
MGAAQHLLGETLTGRRAAAGKVRHWKLVERLLASDDLTPGQFSVGYRVEDQDGRAAFMKITDLELMTGGTDDLLERIAAAAGAHKFERRILDHCQGNNMDRVVTAIDFGESPVEVEGDRDVIFFLVFELAEGDIRRQVSSSRGADFLWCVGALHHLAVAVQQLHGGGVCHNDIKPANFLLFTQEMQKLADLGCATSGVIVGAHDQRHDAGDPTYAPPEVLYAHSEACKSGLCQRDRRREGDLYQLGSVAWFMTTGRMMTPTIVDRLARPHRPPIAGGGWAGSLHGLLPYWREAQSRALSEEFDPALRSLAAGVDPDVARRFREAVLQLVEPDPTLRGHPQNRTGTQDPLGVERYIALLDYLRRSLFARG